MKMLALPVFACIVLMLSLTPHLSAGVPKPYTPVKASGSEFGCLGRETKLGALLLPAQIESAGKELLTGPIALSAEPASVFEKLSGEGRVIASKDDSAFWVWVGESSAFDIQVGMTGECDGFSWYEITLSPKKPVELKALRLEIPRRAETAKYIHAAAFTWGGKQISRGLPEIGGKWSESFMPYVWLGDEDRGLAWFCESDEGWRLKDPGNALKVETIGEKVVFTATFLDHAETIESPITLRFGLQASPVKPVSFEWRSKARIMHGAQYSMAEPDKDGKIPLDALKEAGVRTIIYHDMWPEYYGQLKPSDERAFRKLIEECHKRGMKLLVYVGYGIARTAPDIQGHHHEWSVVPLIPWDPSYKPEMRAFDATCARSGWADWLAQGIEKLFAEYNLDGLYFDGTSEAWRCQNESHGCGWRDSDGNLHTVHPLLSVRSLMRRVTDIVRKRRPDAILDVHMSASLTLPTLSFCDSYWDGEQYEMYAAKDKIEIPLDAFRTEFMGWAHGLDAEFLCYTNRPFTMEEAIAVSWLHGVEVRPGGPDTLAVVSRIWGALDRFGYASAKWLPYWSGSGVTCADDSVKASAWAKDGKALIFVSHLKREPLSTALELDPSKLGLPSSGLSAADALTGEALSLSGPRVLLEFAGMSYRVIEVR
jgi:hypothetical protein